MSKAAQVIPFDRLRMDDIEAVGGKNASLGEMIGELAGTGIRVPEDLQPPHLRSANFSPTTNSNRASPRGSTALDVDDVRRSRGAGAEIRSWVPAAAIPRPLARRRSRSFTALTLAAPDATWAVRSSATAEDLPDASFAGQQETFLNINGLDNILHAISEVFASLYNDRAIAYRVHKGFAHARCRAVRRHSADGAQRPWCGRGDVHARHRVRVRSGRLHHSVLRLGRDRRAGCRQSGRVLSLQAEPRRGSPRDPAQECRQQGDTHGVRERAKRASRPSPLR